MISALFRTEPDGLFIYYPDGKLTKGELFRDNYLDYKDNIVGVYISMTIWALFHEFRMHLNYLYIIAKAINERIPNNGIDWKTTFEYLALEQLRIDQETLVCGGKFFHPRTEWECQDRAIIVGNRIKTGNLEEKAMQAVSEKVLKYGLV